MARARASGPGSRRPPMRLTMTVVGAVASVAPSGRSRTARRCWANWLVTAPSWVQ